LLCSRRVSTTGMGWLAVFTAPGLVHEFVPLQRGDAVDLLRVTAAVQRPGKMSDQAACPSSRANSDLV
jgi:hypothetical protein